ncbi:MAG: leucyl/phenylalanyl-tRNA--protein transferase [Gammaproteobacteria bacterium]|jgi:leucyl/phenylalanyl-tRNA--protein transferase
MSKLLLWLEDDSPFPPLDQALVEPDGLLCAGGDLSVDRLLDAYSQGIFPWYSEGDPILWWSPDPRMVLAPSEIKISRSLAKIIRNSGMEVRFNSAFSEVIHACAKPRNEDTGSWIIPEMIEAYIRLHQAGYALSAETWQAGKLVGGLYGVRIGRLFFGESMFSQQSNASKVAFVALCRKLELENVALIDCQMKSSHLASLGAYEIPRLAFAQIVASSLVEPRLSSSD